MEYLAICWFFCKFSFAKSHSSIRVVLHDMAIYNQAASLIPLWIKQTNKVFVSLSQNIWAFWGTTYILTKSYLSPCQCQHLVHLGKDLLLLLSRNLVVSFSIGVRYSLNFWNLWAEDDLKKQFVFCWFQSSFNTTSISHISQIKKE